MPGQCSAVLFWQEAMLGATEGGLSTAQLLQIKLAAAKNASIRSDPLGNGVLCKACGACDSLRLVRLAPSALRLLSHNATPHTSLKTLRRPGTILKCAPLRSNRAKTRAERLAQNKQRRAAFLIPPSPSELALPRFTFNATGLESFPCACPKATW